MTQTEREEELKRLTKAIMDYRMMINLPEDFKEQCIALAEYLIYGIGVIVPPCKAGDTMFYNSLTATHEVVVSSLYFDIDLDDEICVIGQDEYFEDGEVCINLADCGNRLFKTREAAEQALKEREKKMKSLECPVCKKEAIYAVFDFKKNGCKFVCRECGYETRMYYSTSMSDSFDYARCEVYKTLSLQRK